jgi:hypothetical protein
MGECMGDPEANWYRSPTGRVATSSVFTPPACASTRASSSIASSTSSGAVATPTGVSTDGSCGSTAGLTCLGFADGECCSQYNYCGSSEGHCGDGCQKGFGKCGLSSSSLASSRATSASTRASASSAPSSTPSGITSPDGSCGSTKGYTCAGFSEGECCSQYNYCGNSASHCGVGCNPLFGKCTSSGASSSVSKPASSTPKPASSTPAVTSSKAASSSPVRSSLIPTSKPASSTPKPSSTTISSTRVSSAPSTQPTGKKTPLGMCGRSGGGYHCLGYMFGECCGQFGWCGSGSFYCGSRCQRGYGKCN